MSGLVSTMSLSNGFRLKKKNLMLRMITAYPPSKKSRFRNIKIITYFLLWISIVGRIIGFYRIKKKSYTFLDAYLKTNSNIEKFSIRDTNSQYYSIYEYEDGLYEPDVACTKISILKKGNQFLDVGANWGHHTIFAAKVCNARVISIEPNPDVFEDLSRTIKELGVADKVKSINVALGDKNSRMFLEQHYYDSGVGSINKDFSKWMEESLIYEKRMKRLLKIKSINYPIMCKKLDDININNNMVLWKVDVEGEESKVIKGALITLRRNRPFLILEFHNKLENNFKDYRKMIESENYIVYEIKSMQLTKGKHSVTYEEIGKGQFPTSRYGNVLAVPAEKLNYLKELLNDN